MSRSRQSITASAAASKLDRPEESRLLFDDVTDLPLVPLLIGKMQRILGKSGQLGLLTIHIAQDIPVEHTFSWRAFDGMLRDVAEFLAEFKERSLRREDDVSDMMVNGNAFVILVSPPIRRTSEITSVLRSANDDHVGVASISIVWLPII